MNSMYFLLGVLTGNIIDIKYILIFMAIYKLIKNDPIGGIYPRTAVLKIILWLKIKSETKIHNTAINMTDIDGSQPIIEDIDDDNNTLDEQYTSTHATEKKYALLPQYF